MECSSSDREKYIKYNKMSKKDLAKASNAETLEHAKYFARKGFYTSGVARQTFCEAISSSGKDMMSTLTKRWRGILKKKTLKSKMLDYWFELEDKHGLEEIIWRGSKRRLDDEDMPSLPSVQKESPTSVVLFPGEEGYDEYIKQLDGDSSDTSDDEDENDEVGI